MTANQHSSWRNNTDNMMTRLGISAIRRVNAFVVKDTLTSLYNALLVHILIIY